MSDLENKCMESTIKLLRLLGTWPRWSQMDKLSEKVYACYTAFIVTLMTIYMAILTYGLVTESDWTSTELPIEDIIVYSTGLIVLVKILVIITNQRSLQEVIDYINFDLNKREVVNQEDRDEILICVKHEKMLLKMYVGSAGVLIVLFTASSIIKLLKPWNENYDDKLPLKYPFQINDKGLFMAAYIHQFIVMIINGEVGTLADALFTGLLYYICGHLRIVRNRYTAMETIEKSCVEYHVEVLRLVQKVEAIFQDFLFFMFSVDSFLICLGLLQITHGQSSGSGRMSYEKSIIYLTIKLSQLFIYCWYGQEIIDRSSDVSFACYCTKWYTRLGRGASQRFLFTLHRSQKPVMMKAGAFFFVSINTLKSVMNTAYSFFTMVNSLQK